MASLKVEGDCAQINDKQLNFIKSAIENRGFKNNKVVIEPLGKVGDNYMANVKRIVVEDGNERSFKMVAKIAPQLETQRKFGNTEAVFRNEHIVYTKLLPKFTQLEKTYDIPPQEWLRYPICYGSSDDSPNEVILLEDLNESDFKMMSRFEPLNNDCIKSIIKNFAQLHSLSFALKYKEPEVFEEFKNDLVDMWVEMEETMGDAEDLFKKMEFGIVSILESDYHKKAVQGAMFGSFKNFGKFSKIAKNSKHSIIQHGDSWTNNFLFKFDGDKVVQSILIDYQIAKVANPVADLLFMISICTEYDARKEYFYEWIDYYHSELDKALSNYGLKSNYVYPKDQLDVDLKRYGKVIFGQTILMVGMIALKPEDAVVMKEAMQQADMEAMATQSGAANSKDPETVDVFKKKIEGLVESYHDFGLL